MTTINYERDRSEFDRPDEGADDHCVDLSILLKERLQTDQDTGLSSKEHRRRLDLYGPNRMSPPKTIPEWLKILKTMTGFFSLLLLAGGALCFVGYALKKEVENLYLGVVLVAVVVFTGLFTYFQEKQSSNLMESFKSMMPDRCTVVRDGKPAEVNAEDLVVGDIVMLKAGDRVPADLRILTCSDDMQVDNASLTGESEPCKRSPVCTDANPLESQNMAFFGTQVPKGTCKGVVLSVGDHTFMGKIAKLTLTTGSDKTPIAVELDHFISIISIVAITLGVLFFIIGCFLGTDLITNLVFMIGIIVANVPEGLLATVTVSLSLTANRMSSKNVLVKNLEGVETLGSTSCICSDKTGTLTQNMMTVANVVYDASIFDCACSMYEKPTVDPSSLAYSHLLRVAALCNNAKWDETSKYKKLPDGSPDYASKQPFTEELLLGDGSTERRIMWKPLGDASESALLKYVQTCFDVELFRRENPKLKEIPFNSTNKYQVSVHKQSGAKELLLVMKGAPERILGRCDTILLNGQVVPFTPALRSAMESLQLDLSRRGLRVLGFAELILDPSTYSEDYPYNSEIPNFPLGEDPSTYPADRPHTDAIFTKLCYVGMMAMIDPPRPQVPPAVEKCKSSGIRVIMVTGDHPVTAKAIAAKVGIIWGDTAEDVELRNETRHLQEGDPGWEDPALAPVIVVPGWELTSETPDEIWEDILDHPQVVFARTSPQQKLEIVEHNQRRGEVVAVTGDGVNDAPALRKADIGIAMGIMGSAVSKEAADMILVDDNFASIVKGVEEGRLIFDNLKKSIAYTLSSNIPEIGPFLAFITLQIPLPLDTILILLIDLGTDMFPAISFAYEAPESDIMKRPPRDSKQDRLVNRKLLVFAYLEIGVIQCIAAFFVWFQVMQAYGFRASTLLSLGAYDNWGKQTLYCKTTGGAYYREVGEPSQAWLEKYEGVVQSVEEYQKAASLGYVFWSDEDDGKIVGCHFPSKHLAGTLASPPPSFSLADPSSYHTSEGIFTGGQTVVTRQSIDVLLRQGYFPYIPLRGRLSPFWSSHWLAMDLTSSSAPGLSSPSSAVNQSERETREPMPSSSTTTTSTLLNTAATMLTKNAHSLTKEVGSLAYQPIGVWTLTAIEDEGDEEEEGKGKEKNMSGSPQVTSAVAAMIAADEQYRGMGGKLYHKATLSQSISTADPDYVYSLTTRTVNGTVTLNIASRMIQKEALHYAQTSYLVTIIVVQIADLLICKTRMVSLVRQGMHNNAMNSALVFELMLAGFLLYFKPLNNALRTRPLPLTSWMMGLPFFILIILFDEGRKLLMRKTSTITVNEETKQLLRETGWIERNTYY